MSNFFKLTLIISLNSLLVVPVIGSSSLNPDAKPFIPSSRNNRSIPMFSAHRNNISYYATQERLVKISLMSIEELKALPKASLHVLFCAVNNDFHLAAYNAAIRLFSFPEALYSKNLSSKLEMNEILSLFYTELASLSFTRFTETEIDRFLAHALNLSKK